MVLNALGFGRQFNGKILGLYALLAAALLPAQAAAHDFWIEPQIFRPAVGAKVPLRLLVGQQFKGEPALYVPEQFERYIYVGPAGERNVEGTLGDDPAGSVPVAEPGLYIVGYFSKKFEVTFDSLAEFEKYLEMEGLERNLAIAKKRATLRSGILEIYTRCAKSLIQSGKRGAKADRVLGFPLELIPESNPYDGGSKLGVRLIYRNKPLEGALVVAFNKESPTDRQRIRTDKDGRAVFELNKRGVWLITSVHQIPTSFLSRADWESFWASVTFERP
ncbi:MAG: DUF4198 domain-containing protein [Sulfurifustaceae bacterium]